LREAVNYGINREELWKYAAKGNAFNLGGYIPTGEYGHNPILALFTYDTTRARSLLAEAGYLDGFEVRAFTAERWAVEAQIITKMLERIGLMVELQVLPYPEYVGKLVVPLLDKPPEEQDWDMVIGALLDWCGHPGIIFHSMPLIEASGMRWIEYDPVYEQMWEDMARTVAPDLQEDKIRQMQKYIYDHVDGIWVYSPLTLYAVNKEVDFVPHKSQHLILKETSVTDNHWSLRVQTN
jgi:peptide/nickel transport system substrate-binding protein